MLAKTLAFLSALLNLGQKVLIRTVATLVIMVLVSVVLLVVFIDCMIHIVSSF